MMKIAACERCKIVFDTIAWKRAKCPCCLLAVPQRNMWREDGTRI
jgi:hypothetical protein